MASQFATMKVEVAYAKPDKQLILTLEVHKGATVAEAIRLSGISTVFPEADFNNNEVGIFGEVTNRQTRLRAGDRVEIYRPLIADPREARRKRVARGLGERKPVK